MQNVRRYIAFYEKDGSEKKGEIPLPDMDLADLADIVARKETDPLFYDPYFIDDSSANTIYKKYKILLCLLEYDYYLEAEAI